MASSHDSCPIWISPVSLQLYIYIYTDILDYIRWVTSCNSTCLWSLTIVVHFVGYVHTISHKIMATKSRNAENNNLHSMEYRDGRPEGKVTLPFPTTKPRQKMLPVLTSPKSSNTHYHEEMPFAKRMSSEHVSFSFRNSGRTILSSQTTSSTFLGLLSSNIGSDQPATTSNEGHVFFLRFLPPPFPRAVSG